MYNGHAQGKERAWSAPKDYALTLCKDYKSKVAMFRQVRQEEMLKSTQFCI